MATITNNSINEKTLANLPADTDITWDESTETWDDANVPWENPGRPITKNTINEKSLTSLPEHI
jgi:hypothetical protein